MATPSEILQLMIDSADEQIDNLNTRIALVDQKIAELTEQIDGVENGLCEVAKTDLTAYITDTKLTELEDLHGGETPYSFSQGANYGTIDYDTGGITDWEVLDNLGSLVYKYEGLNWDSDSTITEKISDFAFGNQYLETPLSGSDYGLITYRTVLTSTKAELEAARDNLTESKIIFAKYV